MMSSVPLPKGHRRGGAGSSQLSANMFEMHEACQIGRDTALMCWMLCEPEIGGRRGLIRACEVSCRWNWIAGEQW